MRKNHLLQALAACSMAAFALSASADAMDDWIAFRVANNLAVDPAPSKPGELPDFGGPVPDALLEPLPDTIYKGNGNGNGNGSSHKCDPLIVEMARSEGDPRGEDAICH